MKLLRGLYFTGLTSEPNLVITLLKLRITVILKPVSSFLVSSYHR